MKHYGLIYYLWLLVAQLSAQPVIEWQKTFGGTSHEQARSVWQTADGGYFIGGHTVSDDGDIFNNRGGTDFWAIKMDSPGNVTWSKNYGGSNDDWAYSAQPTIDGGYIMAGFTESNDGDVTGNHGNKDAWILKLDINGAVQWQKCLGGTHWDEAWEIHQTPDDGYIVAGASASTDGDLTINQGYFDYWIIKLNSTAEIEWQRSFGGSLLDACYTVSATNDGGYIIAGRCESNNGNVLNHHGSSDAWVLKLNFEGKIEWQNALGGTGADRANDIQQTKDGGYILCGQSTSKDGDASFNYGGYDFWVVKLNESGTVQWQRSLGGAKDDIGLSIYQTKIGDYVALGYVKSSDGEVTGNHGYSDVWIVKLSADGELKWQKTFGGTLDEQGYHVQPTTDGGYILAGDTWSNNGDVSGVLGKTDLWVVKLSSESTPTTTLKTLPLDIFPNLATYTILINIPFETSNLTICATDLLGRELSRQTRKGVFSGSIEMDISQYPNGMYQVNIQTHDGRVFSGHFVKQ